LLSVPVAADYTGRRLRQFGREFAAAFPVLPGMTRFAVLIFAVTWPARFVWRFRGWTKGAGRSDRRRRILRGIERDLSGSDPGLARLFSIFTLLTQGEEMPGAEKVRAVPVRVLAAAAAKIVETLGLATDLSQPDQDTWPSRSLRAFGLSI
jgi:hypothetical protein